MVEKINLNSIFAVICAKLSICQTKRELQPKRKKRHGVQIALCKPLCAK